MSMIAEYDTESDTMTPTPVARQMFRELVAQVAAKAREKLPLSVNGRIEGAVKLVLSHDVVCLEDGTIEVGSCTDPLKTYRLSGQACTCKDFTDGKAPQGWCRHRIAAGIDKRVRELLPQALPVKTEEPVCYSAQTSQTPPLPEAPASVNVHLTISGRQVQLTLCDTDEARLLQRLAAVLAQYPVPQPTAEVSRPSQEPSEGWCAKHGVQMKWNEGKEGRKGWFSHRDAAGAWCKGR